MMKILLASHLFFPRHSAGTEVLTLELARSLRRKGHDVHIVTCTRHEDLDARKAPWLTEEQYDDFTVSHLNFGTKDNTVSVAHHIDSPARLSLLENRVIELSPDLVHFHHIHGFSAAAISKIKLLGIPVFYTATDFWAICTRTTLYRPQDNSVCSGPETSAKCLSCAKPGLTDWMARAAIAASNNRTAKLSDAIMQVFFLKNRLSSITGHLNAANRVIAATNFQAGMLTQYGVDKNLIHIVPYGVRLGDLPPQAELPRAFDVANPLKVVFIGSLIPIKGLHILLEALCRLPREKLECIDLRIYGAASNDNSDYYTLLNDYVSRLHGTAKFSGTFRHDEIGAVMRSAHLCVVPSIWYENAPLVLCSAIAAGTPVLVSKMSGMTEIIEEAKTGKSFNTGDSSELATTLMNLVDDPAWIKNAMSQQVNSYRTPDDYCDVIESLYSTAINDSKSASYSRCDINVA
jgi:glycosyltransferase involved in cell wall biosynthesis